jgi:hypothetical protein
MKNTHTSGPWTKEGATILQSDTNKGICKLLGSEQDQNANARLIAAAPDLLQVVEDYLLLCQLHDYVGAVSDAAREALRKAKGEA